jgi:hypothetical protein
MLGVVLGIVVGYAMLCAGASARAETYTPHTRHASAHRITARYTTAHYVTHRAGSRSAGAHAGRSALGTATVQNRRQAHERSARLEPVRETVSSRRASGRERRAVRGEQSSNSTHRSNARRRHGRRRDPIDVLAETPKDSSPAEATDAERAAPATDKGLTVNDFVQAAGTHRNGIYASGVSRPDEDVSVTETSATVAVSRAAAQPAGTASMEAASSGHEPAPSERSAPSDLVGAPLAASAQQEDRVQPRAKPADAGIAPATHMELTEEVEQPVVLPGLYRDGRLVVPPPMRGTREILVHQNLIADEEGLSRIQDDDDLRRMRSERMLVDFPESASLRVNPELAPGPGRCASQPRLRVRIMGASTSRCR